MCVRSFNYCSNYGVLLRISSGGGRNNSRTLIPLTCLPLREMSLGTRRMAHLSPGVGSLRQLHSSLVAKHLGCMRFVLSSWRVWMLLSCLGWHASKMLTFNRSWHTAPTGAVCSHGPQWKRVECPLRVRDVFLHKVEEFNYLRILFKSEESGRSTDRLVLWLQWCAHCIGPSWWRDSWVKK